jgi:hypothetical protein
MNLDDLLLKRFDIRTYNCWDLTREVWLRLTGQDLGSPELIYFTRDEFGQVVEAWHDTRFKEIYDPLLPCLVLMLRPRIMPHVGVYLGQRENVMIHITKLGVRVQPVALASMGFTAVRYYLPCRP